MKLFSNALTLSTSSSTNDVILFDIYIALCDALIDDDEDIRDNAAKIASTIFSCSPSTAQTSSSGQSVLLMPSAALDRMFDLITSCYTTSSCLFLEGVSRMTRATTAEGNGDNEHSTVDLRSADGSQHKWCMKTVKQELDIVMRQDTTLFAVEKQNLFVDEVQDAQRWAKTLQKLQPDFVDPVILSKLEKWVVEGIETLVETAQKEDGGVLGWTYISDTYVIGMRVFFTAEVLLQRKWQDYYHIEVRDILVGMQSMAEICEMKELHPLWRSQLSEILGRQARIEAA